MSIRQINDNGNFFITGLYPFTATHGIPLAILIDQLHSCNADGAGRILKNRDGKVVGHLNPNNKVEACLPEFWAAAILDNRTHEYIMATFKESLIDTHLHPFDEVYFKTMLIAFINKVIALDYCDSTADAKGWARAIRQYYWDRSEPCEWIIKKKGD